jgi:hypothetical protein
MIKTISQMFIKTGTYATLLEESFLNKTRDFYSQLSDQKISSLGVIEYVDFAMALI